MSRRLDPSAAGASTTLGVRFDASALAIIDREASRLEVLTGEPCDRSRALRSIVRRFGAELAADSSTPPRSGATAASGKRSKPSQSPGPSRASTAPSTPSKRSKSERASRVRAKPSPTAAAVAARWTPVPEPDRMKLARELAARLDAMGKGAVDRVAKETGIHRATLYDARKGHVGHDAFTALRRWLDSGAPGPST